MNLPHPTRDSAVLPADTSGLESHCEARLYHIRASSAPSVTVDAWSVERLPFEPHAWQRAFRRDLRAAVQQLAAPQQACLHAIYTSPEDGQWDAENVLFYNVGPVAFAHAMANGVRFERVIGAAPSCPIPLTDDSRLALHHYLYALAPRDAPWHIWSPDATLATWEVGLKPTNLSSCASVWRAMKQGQIQPLSRRATDDQPFGLRLWLDVPEDFSLRLHTLLKPLLDGVISALHQYEGNPTNDVCDRLTAGPQIDATMIRGWLMDSTSAVLGLRANLVKLFRAGVKWNPQDDACAAADIRITRTQGTPTLRGEMMTLRRNVES